MKAVHLANDDIIFLPYMYGPDAKLELQLYSYKNRNNLPTERKEYPDKEIGK